MIVFLIDADNLSAPAWVDEACQALEATEGTVAVRRAYGSAENLKGLAEVLRSWAIRPFVNLSLSKNTTDVALAVDAMELACQTPRPSLVVIGSGDADFVPLVVRLRERGVRVVCVSERSKLAHDTTRAYDKIVFVGASADITQVAPQPLALPGLALNVKKSAVKKTAVKKVATKTPKKVTTKAVAKAAVKALAPNSDSEQSTTNTMSDQDAVAAFVQAILVAAPALRFGQAQALGDVAKALHDAKLLGKNTASTKLLKKFPDYFELTPTKQPNQVRYLSMNGA